MTNQILSLPNLKAVSAITAFGLGVNAAFCGVSQLLWSLTREVFGLVCSAALVAWHSSHLEPFLLQHVLGCPLTTVSLLLSVLHAIARAL